MDKKKKAKKAKMANKRYQSRKHKQLICERCRFEAEDRAQIDVHHRDHNPRNQAASNCVSLCANCHRLVTAAEVFIERMSDRELLSVYFLETDRWKQLTSWMRYPRAGGKQYERLLAIARYAKMT